MSNPTRAQARTMPVGQIRAALGPKTLNEESRSVEMTWSTGERGIRQGWEGSFYEELSMKSQHIRMSRAKNGLPLVDGHRSWDNDANIGIVEGIKLEKRDDGARVGFGVARFDTHELAQKRMESVKNGILRDVSVGYRVYKYERVEDVEEHGKKVPVYRAVDWEPIEISLVTAGFETTSKIRSGDNAGENEVLVEVAEQDSASVQTDPLSERTILGSTVMDEAVAPKVEQICAESVRSEAAAKERNRVSEIMKDCQRAGFSDLAQGFVDNGSSADAVRALLLEKLAERTANVPSASIVRDESETKFQAMSEAVCARANPQRFQVSEKSRPFMRYTLCDMIRELTGLKGSNLEVATNALTRAYQTTSSFPALLEDIQTKTLNAEYEANVGSFEPIVRRSTLPDFKPASRVRLGDMPDLLQLPEGAEFQIGESSDRSERIQLVTWGRKIGLSRQAIINDDLDGFSRLPTQFAMKVRNLEANLVYTILNTSPLMADGIPLFNRAGHGNQALAATVISVANLGLAIADFRRQSTETGMPLNLFPRYLVVPPAIEAVARQFTTLITPNNSALVNPYQGSFSLIVDPRLETMPGGSVTAWYLISDPSQVDTIELASLAGGENINIERMDDPNTLGVWWRAYVDRGVAPIDWRGMFKNLGV
jgi:hypothetical protein